MGGMGSGKLSDATVVATSLGAVSQTSYVHLVERPA